MKDCLFCKIADGKIGEWIYQDDQVVAFNDITPQAPHHVLIIPRRHITTLNDATANDEALLGHLILVAKKIAHEKQIADTGYRLVLNCNRNGGQTMFHVHLHLLGGRNMHWPPG